MQFFRGATAVEVIAVRVDAGEDLLGSLNQVVSDCQIAAGSVMAGCGTLEQIRLEVPANLLWPPAVYSMEKQGPGQIVSAQGHVANGYAELYVTVARRNEVLSGKVMPGNKVLHNVELSLLRAGNTRWQRVGHPLTHVPLLQAAAPPAQLNVTLMGRPVDPNAVAMVPQALIRKHQCLPVLRTADTLGVAMVDPNNPFAIDDLREATGMRIQAIAVPPRELMAAIQQLLGERQS